MNKYWRSEAACLPERLPIHVQPADFFPHGNESTEGAKSVCADCPVRTDCLEYALESRVDDGVFGGLTEAERRKLRQSKAVA